MSFASKLFLLTKIQAGVKYPLRRMLLDWVLATVHKIASLLASIYAARLGLRNLNTLTSSSCVCHHTLLICPEHCSRAMFACRVMTIVTVGDNDVIIVMAV